MKPMSSLNRISAWILLVCFWIYMLAGIDTLRRIIAPEISSLIHLKYLFVPAQAAFTFHSSYALGKALMPKDRCSISGVILLTLYVLLNLALLGYFIFGILFA